MTLTGTWNDFGFVPVYPEAGRLFFVPHVARGSIGIYGARVAPVRPVEAEVFGNTWSVELTPTDGVTPEAWYTIAIDHLDAEGNFTARYEYLDKIYIPLGGDWTLQTLPGAPLTPNDVLVQLAPPPEGYAGWYLNAPGPGEPTGDPNNPASSGTGILEIVS